MLNRKLVHVTSSLRMGGAEKLLYVMVAELQKEGFDQTVLYVHDGPYRSKLHALGIKTYQVKGTLFRYDPLFFIRLYRLIKREQPSVVHSLLWAANVSSRLSCWLLKIPVVSVYHNNVDQDGAVRSLLDQLTLSLASHIVAVSDQVAQSISSRSWRPVERLSVITNGIAVDDNVVPFRSKEDLGIAKDSFVIGAVGRLVSIKRFEYLLEAYAQSNIKQSCLVLVGSGPLERLLRQTAVRALIADRVYFITDHEALPYYQLFDCFVQPSDKEGVSLALLEAMSFKKPCIVMGVGGYHPVITDHYDGLVLSSGNQEALIESLCELSRDKEYRDVLGQRAAQTVKRRFDLSVMVNRYKKLFDQLIFGAH